MRETNIMKLWQIAREALKRVEQLEGVVVDLQNQVDELKTKRGPGRPRKEVA